MKSRRLRALSLLFGWHFPALLGAAIGLHVLAESAHADGHRHTPFWESLAEAIHHGHDHQPEMPSHEHVARLQGSGAGSLPSCAGSPEPAPDLLPGVGLPADGSAIPRPGWPELAYADPPRPSGPPLLARLATLRI